ncbi:MAG: twin-arginine translocation signal domain-containing protein [Bacteroidetes bacterium]|nr:twin-arginine translocation signal domain-containing protein [Bacteroidota bacterium]
MSASKQAESRRDFLKKLGLGGLGLGFSSPLAVACAVEGKEPDFTFIHATDMHVTRKRKGVQGYQTFVKSVNTLNPSPALVLMGGDLAFDGLYTDKAVFGDQIDAFKQASDQLKMPYYNAIGNHDLLGWSPRRKVSVSDPDLGKKFIMDKLGMEKSYYSFETKGWHFVVLDALHEKKSKDGPIYEPKLGKEQLDWLRFDLGANSGKPTVVVSHYAAFNHTGQINADTEMKAMNNLVLSDNKELRFILERHSVKAFLQGHTHIAENFQYNGVWYITSQSVSAAWWGGNWVGFKPGYTIFKAFGYELQWEHVSFDWEHHLEPEDTVEKDRIAKRMEFEETQRQLLAEETKDENPVFKGSVIGTELN